MTDSFDLNPAFSAAFNSGDAGRVADLYEQDAVFQTATGPVSGRDAIRDHYAELLASSPKMEARLRQALTCGDIALLTSDWTFTLGAESASGLSAEVVRRQADGTWKYAIDEPKILR